MKRETIDDLNRIYSLEVTNWDTVRKSPFALLLHLMPPCGWLNDPNGLCQLNGKHHIFFQYSPDDANGANKYWGHYETTDFIHYSYTGILLCPDEPIDKDGVYSGSALVKDDAIYLFYTGNVLKPGDHDYILSGRGSNTTFVKTMDGISYDAKTCVMSSSDYPSFLSLHVRDPKVFCENDTYYMVLGARTKEDVGCVMLYESKDLKHWNLNHFIKSDSTFGYMWECPDLFSIDGKYYLSISPQGVASETYRYQNLFQSGYFSLSISSLPHLQANASLENALSLSCDSFFEWDYGFDFYAPQTYLDENNRSILIGWMGLADEEYTNPTIKENWQHALTIPRELTCDEKGIILQNPVSELTRLRQMPISANEGAFFTKTIAEFIGTNQTGESFEIIIDHGIYLTYDKDSRIFSFHFCEKKQKDSSDYKTDIALGKGRSIRQLKLAETETITDFHIILDQSAIELYLNKGRYVFTSRFYKKDAGNTHYVSFSSSLDVTGYILKPISISYENHFIKE